MKDKRYEQLDRIIGQALDQAKSGKGCERHATGEPFEQQKICVISRWLKGSTAAGPLFQAAKKIFESATLQREYHTTGRDRAIHELRGAINYLAAAILLIEEEPTFCVTTDYSIQVPSTEFRACMDCDKDGFECLACDVAHCPYNLNKLGAGE